jgi:CarD family transcriptional regulator
VKNQTPKGPKIQQPRKVPKSNIVASSLKVGDNAVYPGHGVGRVLSIDTKEIMGTKHSFFTIEIIETGMKIMIPATNLQNVGLRPIISESEAQEVIRILKMNEAKVDNQTWNRRYREYMEKIKTGSVFEIAEVLRDLFLLKVDKELSFGERKLLDTARGLLLKELRLATKSTNFEEEKDIKDIFGLA